MSWTDRAWDHIRTITADLPKDTPFRDRAKLLRENYPFAQRKGWAYKAWLTAQRRYLAQFQPPSSSKRFPLSPLEKMMLKTEQHDSLVRRGLCTGGKPL
ncbi:MULTISPECIES: hypothetical protein [unclassified Bradyrhizobium]|uniref:hypothetical protein n=1 Tax=unclassified Bradyrhizobium TaxID=2631580 RepID=UPI001BAAC702|nr:MULTISPECIES: hypothetical protein [unclassified Bradyrhizobium]MBR1206581.1 hypothetical protein [Bradyrhizobium sp. AUGA SZCCT0124]MBR1315441.1 hypothetical protein [Bradyrhizobium sp. AUGA SZCCT0051]MBR1338497.1 hypothetical protein [Bradyrhizobium sp. AUGA SZCCT0105]MBR1356152.1 hypothetical protein [Bradyrhizobium sp. AUGA SZCCT0045]